MALACLVPAVASGQGDGPRTQLLMPVGINVLAPTWLDLSSNFNFSQSILINDAEVSSDVGVLTYMRTFSLGDRFAQVSVSPIFGSVEGELRGRIPPGGFRPIARVSASGVADPYVAVRVGLSGAPALDIAAFAQHRPTFQVYGYLGAYVPVGEYDDSRLLNMGTNRWAIRFGVPMVVPLGDPRHGTFLELHPGWVLYTDNTDPSGGADRREQDPLLLLEAHLSHNLTRQLWGAIDLRYQRGGETTTDGVADDNRIDQLGGGVTLGYQFTRSLALQITFGDILAERDGSEGDMLRIRATVAF